MKTQSLFRILLLLLVVFGFSSCADEDNTIEISQLTGTWADIHEDYTTLYVFGSNKTCQISVVGPAINSDSRDCTYEISEDYKFIKLTDTETHFERQYQILKMTSSEMEWLLVSLTAEYEKINLKKQKE